MNVKSLYILFLLNSERVMKKLPTLLCTVIFLGTVDIKYLFYITFDYIFVHDVFCKLLQMKLILVATWSKVQVCSCLLGGIVGWNPSGSKDVCLLRVLCVVR